MKKSIPKLAKVIIIANHKGGVGKTVSVYNIAAALARFHKKKVLIIDADGQSNLTSLFDNKEPLFDPDWYFEDFLFGRTNDIKTIICKTSNENIDIMPSTDELCVLEINHADLWKPHHIKESLEPIRATYDFIIIDSPPSLSQTTISAVIASQYLFIPLRADGFSINGLATFIDYAKDFNRKIKIKGVFLTMFEKRQITDHDFFEALESSYPDIFIKQTIRKSVVVTKATLMKQTVFDFSNTSEVAKDYKKLTNEILKRVSE